MSNIYDPKALITLPGRSRIDLSYRNTFTAKMAQLIPIYAKPVVPGDRFRFSLVYQMQLAPMLNPVYDGLTVNFEAFFVPNRIIDKKWREFWTGYNEYDQMTKTDIAPLEFQVSIHGDESSTEVDSVRGNGVGRSSLLNYLGLQFSHYKANGMPIFEQSQGGDGAIIKFNALPLLGYHRIFDDWYRNERTQQASLYRYYNSYEDGNTYRTMAYTIFSGDSVNDMFAFHQRNYAKDRFTTALPEPVIGGDVHIPINGSFTSANGVQATDVFNLDTNGDDLFYASPSVPEKPYLNALALGTIQQLKLAYKEYEFRMKDTYNGNRYVESIESHYGVRVPDSTLQRSLYLGSARDYVNFGEVYQTSAGNGDDLSAGALGDYAGRGSSNGTHFLFDETFYEPGYCFVIFSIAPKARYFQGVQRHLVRYERDDYFSPEFQNIGDDFIQNREIFNKFTSYDSNEDNEGIFGYQTRWYDLKSNYDELHGDFADVRFDADENTVLAPMMSWTFARAFGVTPTISSKFSQIGVINRPFVETDERNDNYFVDVYFDIQALRPILTTESF